MNILVGNNQNVQEYFVFHRITAAMQLNKQAFFVSYQLCKKYISFLSLFQARDMKNQDVEESVSPGSEDAPPTAGDTDAAPPSAAKGSSISPKESGSQDPQTEAPPQDHEGESEGKPLYINSVHV